MSETIQMLGGFRLLGTLKGGTDGRQGTVYRAECVQPTVSGVAVGEIVVLKTMEAKDDSERSFEKLRKRTEVLSSLNHKNILRYRGCFSDVGPFSSLHVVVTDLLEGETLKERLAAHPGGLDADEALRIVDGALAGLYHAAKAGIVHRDIQPGNIFICRDGSVKLIDFELGRATTEAITASGSFVGAFNYMAPEFADESFRGDETSDVFSMGVVLHEALTGVLPYAKDRNRGEQADFAFLSRWKQRLEGLCVIHIKSSINKILISADGVLRKALADDRKVRYATAEEFRKGLATIRFWDLRNSDSGSTYRLLRVVGKGGFGEVFKARDLRTGRDVAVKRLLDAHYGKRFEREATIMKKLDDPSFVRFVDYFTVKSVGHVYAYLVMYFLPGMPGASLRDAIKRHTNETLAYGDVLKAFALYAKGLSKMHLRGIYHRDIKPSNLYYPSADISRSAIMDLGIARDVNGSVTTDQVPGTLDYMPYEIAYGTSRGDAAMDVYALGLCLYEALTSKTAFPRLPAGRVGVEKFLQRARERVKPNFDAPQVTARPALLQLLNDMTNLDVSVRISDADVVRRRIEALFLVPDRPPPQRPNSPVGPKPTPRPPQSDPDSDAPVTSHTVIPQGNGLQTLIAAIKGHEEQIAKCSFAAVLLVGLAIGVKLAWKPVADRLSAKRIDDYNRIVVLRERERIAKKREKARLEAESVASRYASETNAIVSADLAAEEWRSKWYLDSEVKDTFTVATNFFAEAKSKRMESDKRRKDAELLQAARSEGYAICAAYVKQGRALAHVDELAEAWRQKWKAKLDDYLYKEIDGGFAEARQRSEDRIREEEKRIREERERADELKEAERDAAAQAKEIEKAFEDESILQTKTEAQYVRWQGAWTRYADQAFYRRLVNSVESARRERSLLDSGRAVSSECDRWLANIENVSSYNVKNWRNNLKQAELELKKALNAGSITERVAAQVRNRIDARKKWKIGVIDNKTSRSVQFGDSVITPTTSGTVIFKGGFPFGAAITCEGHEPIRIREDLFDGRTFTILPRMLVRCKDDVRAVVPQVGKDVICLVDGVAVRPGEITLSAGTHHVFYRRNVQTYAGIDDYKAQNIVFTANAGSVVQIPPPQGGWTASREFSDAAKSDKQAACGKKIVALVEKLLAPEPVSDRRSRLENVHKVLSNWETPPVLATLGVSVEPALNEKYEAERRRVRGMIRNETEIAAKIRTDCSEISIPAGRTVMVTFEKDWPGDAYVELANYEFVFLPHVASDFDGKEFVVDAAKLVPKRVCLFVPPIESGVSCKVNDQPVEGEIKLQPGSYDCVYTKPDCVAQKFVISVNPGEDMTLPLPKAWEPSGAMSRFASALDLFNSGAVSAAKAIAEKVGTIEDPAKRQELEDLRRAIDLREQMERKRKEGTQDVRE